MHMYIFISIYLFTYLCIDSLVYLFIYSFVYLFIYHLFIYLSIRWYVYIYIYMCVCIYSTCYILHVYVYLKICISIYIYISTCILNILYVYMYIYICICIYVYTDILKLKVFLSLSLCPVLSSKSASIGRTCVPKARMRPPSAAFAPPGPGPPRPHPSQDATADWLQVKSKYWITESPVSILKKTPKETYGSGDENGIEFFRYFGQPKSLGTRLEALLLSRLPNLSGPPPLHAQHPIRMQTAEAATTG